MEAVELLRHIKSLKGHCVKIVYKKEKGWKKAEVRELEGRKEER